MGRTFAQSFLTAHIIRPNSLTILEKHPDTIELLRSRNLGTIVDEPGDFIKDIDLIVLAVKPQNTEQLYPTIKPFLKKDQIILSIMAGVTLDTIENALNCAKIVRAMPNLPAQVGMGMTAFTAREALTRNELIEVQNLLSTTGRAIYFEKEEMIDAATAVSGSGPAYVFYFMKSMIAGAMKLGFSESQAELLVWQTFTGAIYLHNKNPLTCDEWIKRVSSKGGTTEAAIKVFEANSIEHNIQNGIRAAFDRAEELGKR